MCGPQAVIAMMVVSTAMSVVGAVQAGQARKNELQAKQQQAEYKAKVSRNNQKIAEWQAEDARARARYKSTEHMRKVRRLAGRQTAVMAASGFTPDIDILGDTEYFGKVDQLTMLAQGEREAYGHKIAASNASAQGLLYDHSAQTFGSEADDVSLLGLGGAAAASGGSQVAKQWYAFDKAGAFG